MIVHDILLQAGTHPDPTPNWAIEQAASLSVSLAARLSLGVCKVHIPQATNWLANKLVNIDGIVAEENRKSSANADALGKSFVSHVPPELIGEIFAIDIRSSVSHSQFAVRARTYDLSIIPIYPYAAMEYFAEGLVFESGRPVLLMPELKSSALTFDRITIAWDGSRVAARALADAIPLVGTATSISVVQIVGDKDLSRAASAADAVRNLTIHGLKAEAIELPLEGGDAGETIQAFCQRHASDLLVMGAFGHSRAREFVLGGVTRTILDRPKLPVLLSH